MAAHWAYDGCDPGGQMGSEGLWYSVHPEFYMPMCPRCHGRLDSRWYEIVKVWVPPRPPPPAALPTPTPTNPRTEAEWDAWARANG